MYKAFNRGSFFAVGFGLAFGAYLSDSFEPPDEFYPTEESFSIRWYRRLPLNRLSQIWGELGKCSVPTWMRVPLFSSYW